MQALLGEVVAIEGHVEHAERFALSACIEQRLGDPDSACTNAYEARLADVALVQVALQCLGHLGQQLFGIWQDHGVSFRDQAPA